MNAKEEANKIVDKMYIVCMEYTEEIQCSLQAKQCAIICVDEIIKEVDDNYDTLHSADRKQFWNEVKREIEKL
jgi:hypothetical protein